MHFLDTLRLSFLILCLSSFHASAITEFVPEDGSANDQFGYAVALKDNIALVGAPGDDDNFRNEGTLYVLEKLNGTWVVKEKIYASDASAENRFGETIIFSRSRNSVIINNKYLFTDDGNGNWTESTTMSIPGHNSTNLSSNIFLDDKIIIGTSSTVEIYDWDGTNWNNTWTLQSDDYEAGDSFGQSLDYDGQYLVIGAPGDYYRGNAGSLYLFEFLNGSWQQISKIWGDNRHGNRKLGEQISLLPNHLVVRDGEFNHYLFDHPRNGLDYFEVPIDKRSQIWLKAYPAASGPYDQCQSNDDCLQMGMSTYHRFRRSLSQEHRQINVEGYLAFDVSRGGFSCIEFLSTKNGFLEIVGILDRSNNPEYGECSSTYYPNGGRFSFSGSNLLRGDLYADVWGQSSGAVFFEDKSASFPEVDQPANESVISGDLSGSVKQGGNISGTLSATDPDGLTDGTYFVITSQPSNGTAFIDQASGAWFYVANAQYEGADPFTVTVTDDQGNTTQQVVSITVTGLTVTGDVNVTFDANTTFNGDINAQDADGLDSLIYSLVVDPIYGTATVDPLSGNWTYEPNADYVGSDSFTIGIAGVGFGQQLINLTIEHPDTDNDSIKDNIDNCINESNADQLDTDGDLQGDACDNDDDADSINDVSDNCPLVANISQEDLDQDGTGDSCDSDRDGDGSQNDTDNCPDNTNAGQEDLDGDTFGDVCDPDIDGDGLLNFIETKFSGDPNDPSDFAQISQLIDELNLAEGEEVTVPMVGGLGLTALFLSILGLGVVRQSRRN